MVSTSILSGKTRKFKKMDKICYKVVIEDNDSFQSTSFSYGNFHSLSYRIGKTIRPTIGKIFVFDTLKNALEFVYDPKIAPNRKKKILKGTAEKVSFPKYCSSSMFAIETFWELKKQKKRINYLSQTVFKGTVWCDSFTPTEWVI